MTTHTMTTTADGTALLTPAIAAPARKSRGRPRKTQPTQWEAVPARECVPAYKAGSGPSSFRHGLPEHERAVVDAALAILGRYLGQPGAAFTSSASVREYLWLQFANEPRELFGLLWLDAQHRMICFETAAVGTLTQASVYPREVARAALTHNAAAVVLVHNHPSGSVVPSDADRILTKNLKNTLILVDCRVLDHIIIGGNQSVSMAEMGMI